MKKLFILALLAMFSTVTFAQITWNAQACINMSSLSGLDESKMKVGYQIGVGMEYAITDMWSVRPSLLFITKGAKSDYTIDDEGYKSTYNPMYLQLPIMAAASFDLSDNMKFVAKAGPYIGFGIGGKIKDEFTYDGATTEVKYDIFDDLVEDGDVEYKAAKRFDFGLGIGAGLEFGKIMVNLDAMFGLVKVADYYTFKDEKKSLKNMTVALSVGYKF